MKTPFLCDCNCAPGKNAPPNEYYIAHYATNTRSESPMQRSINMLARSLSFSHCQSTLSLDFCFALRKRRKKHSKRTQTMAHLIFFFKIARKTHDGIFGYEIITVNS